MATDFSRTLSLLRQEKGISQRKAAGEMGISQALLSHYENGIREPGLAFVVKACDYYHVSADYLLGRTLSRDGAIIGANSVVAKDVPPYCISGGNPCRMIRRRFDDEVIAYLLDLKWWDWDAGKIFRNMEALCSGDLTKIRSIAD